MNNQQNIADAIWEAYQLDLTELIPRANELKEEIRQEMIATVNAIIHENGDYPYAETKEIIDEKNNSLKKMIAEIEKAIRNSNIGLSPMNDGEVIRLNLPPMTEERRKELVKKAKTEIETAKVNVRKVRQDANDSIRKLKNDGVSEDAIKAGEERVQKLTDNYITKVEAVFVEKEKDIMSV